MSSINRTGRSEDDEADRKRPRLTDSPPLVVDDDLIEIDEEEPSTAPIFLSRISSVPGTEQQGQTFSPASSPSARSAPGPLPAYLNELINTRGLNGSNPVKSFSIAKLHQKALEALDLCRIDSYRKTSGAIAFIERQCGCKIPQTSDRTNRPEIKITEPFIITSQQRRLIAAHRGSGVNNFSNSTLQLNEGNSILMKKNVRMHSVVYAHKIGNVFDTESIVAGKTVTWDVSHLCHNGNEGCCEPTHLELEPKTINLLRRDCWRTVKCAINGCNGFILGNQCSGHGLKVDGTPYPLCIKPRNITHRCNHYTGYDELLS